MNYTKKKEGPIKVIGIDQRIENTETASQEIGQMWERFLDEKLSDKIPNQAADDTIYAIYTDYAPGGQAYTTILGLPVSSFEDVPPKMVSIEIPEQTYAVYELKGKFPQSVIEFWDKIWQEPMGYIPAKSADFEKYVLKAEGQDPEVSVHIAMMQE